MKAYVKAGCRVRFVARVFKAPYVPYYDSYKGHEFEVVAGGIGKATNR